MLGAIAGDIIGSIYENEAIKTTEFPLFSRFSHFTDDTVLTIAIAEAVLHRRVHPNRLLDAFLARKTYGRQLKRYGRLYPHAGYGQRFSQWLASDTLDEVLREARLSALVTHNHRQGVRGAQGRINRRSSSILSTASATGGANVWRPFALPMRLIAPARDRFRRLSSRFSNRRMSRTRSARQFPWEGTAIPWRHRPCLLPGDSPIAGKPGAAAARWAVEVRFE